MGTKKAIVGWVSGEEVSLIDKAAVATRRSRASFIAVTCLEAAKKALGG